jgi:hypothetical protein
MTAELQAGKTGTVYHFTVGIPVFVQSTVNQYSTIVLQFPEYVLRLFKCIVLYSIPGTVQAHHKA